MVCRSVSLCFTAPAGARRGLRLAAMEPPTQPRLLVVDDDPALRQLLQDYLGLSGYLVDVAEGGEQMRQRLSLIHI